MTDKQKYRITVRCLCGNEFKKITTDQRYASLDPDSEELKTLMAKVACPTCKKNAGERRLRIGDGLVSDNDLVERSAFISVDRYHCNGCNKTVNFYRESEEDKMSHCSNCGSQDVKYLGHKNGGVIADRSKNMIKALDQTGQMAMETYGMSDINLNSNMRVGDSCAPKLPPVQQNMADGMFNHSKLPGGANYGQIGQRAIQGAYKDPNNPVAALHKSKVKPKFDIRAAPPVNVKTGAKISAYDSMLNKSH